VSQSPQTGQFNSYANNENYENISIQSLNPLKRVNSILTLALERATEQLTESLNPLKRVNSILTILGFREDGELVYSLNPLKRVNSILTGL